MLEINLKGKIATKEFNVYELYKRRLRPLPAAIGLKVKLHLILSG